MGNKPVKSVTSGIKSVLLGLIRAYQLIFSAFLPVHCRFYPTCSHYSAAAIREYGIRTGIVLTLQRLRKCHPWHIGGYDPLPTTKDK